MTGWAFEWALDYWVPVVEWRDGCNPLIEVPGGVREYVLRNEWQWLRPVTAEEYARLPCMMSGNKPV